MLRYIGLILMIGLCGSGWVMGCSGETPGQETNKADGSSKAGRESGTTDGSTGATDASDTTEKSLQEGGPAESVPVEKGPTEPVPVEKGSTESVPVEKPAAKKRIFGGKRPVTIQLPTGYDSSKSLPLLVVLHGYGASGAIQAGYLGFTGLLGKQKFLMIAPNGTVDPTGKRFWNATTACCDFTKTNVNDVAYITGLIKDIKAEYLVDAKRVFVVGHSNGGFMAYRLACDASDQIAAMISLAGATNNSKLLCNPKQKVSVLQIHGTRDSTIRYTGGANFGIRYPGAEESVKLWGGYNGCSGALKATTTTLDLVANLPGAETTVKQVAGCPAGINADLWMIQGGGHVPRPLVKFAEQTWAWFQNHPKP